MSDNNTFYHDYMGTDQGINTFPFFGENPSSYINDQHPPPNIQCTKLPLYVKSEEGPDHKGLLYADSSSIQNQEFVPSSYMTFTECLQQHGSMDYRTLSSAFGMSCSSSSQVVSCPQVVDHQDHTFMKRSVVSATEPTLDSPLQGETSVEISPTPNSSISSTSNEAGGEEESSKNKKHLQSKGCQEVEDDKSKEVSKGKKKGEKKAKEARFAFMTKSEIDNLEDGYRWRKYGQKAVKNSPFPRNYYRCTTQKCGVKKRVERSYEDPAIVITTYEGQHNHHCPATLRGNMLSSHLIPNFSPQLFSQMLPSNDQNFFTSSPCNNFHQSQGPEYRL